MVKNEVCLGFSIHNIDLCTFYQQSSMPSAMYSLDTDGNTSSHGSLSNSSGYSSQSTTGTTGSDGMLPSQGIKGVSL